MSSTAQSELFRAETTWFHVFTAMIKSGDMATLSGAAVKVYLVIKAHTNFSTGHAFPAIDTIGESAGLSKSQVLRCLTELEKAEYLTKKKRGRRNVYTLRERIEFTDDDGRPQAVATWDYLPDTVKHAQAELKNFLLTGKHDGNIIHIENLTLNYLHHNEGVNINEYNHLSEDFLKSLPPNIREKVESALRKKER